LDDTDAATAATFFFLTDAKLVVHILSIVPFVMQAHVERLPYLSIYIFKRFSSSAGRDFIDKVLNMGGSGEDQGSGTCNDVAQ
jgi:hypothetical protein